MIHSWPLWMISLVLCQSPIFFALADHSGTSVKLHSAGQADNLVDYSNVYNWLLDYNYSYIVMSGEMDARDGAIS